MRHICIDLPKSIALTVWPKPVLREEYVQVLQLIQRSCPGLRIIEIACGTLDSTFSLDVADRDGGVLRALDEGFKTMASLEKIVIVGEEHEIGEEVMALRESLMQRLPNGKWSIELTKVTPRVWYSHDDDRVQFDNFEDCCDYNQSRREEQREREEWWEEYDRRRDDPYCKNDSDYD